MSYSFNSRFILRRFLLCCFCIFIVLNLSAQKDSLRQIWKNEALHDTIRIDGLHKLLNSYEKRVVNDTVLLLAEELIEEAIKMGDFKKEYDGLLAIGRQYEERGESRKALEVHKKILKLSKNRPKDIVERTRIRSRAFRNMANFSFQLEDTRIAFQLIDSALVLAQKINNKVELRRIYSSLGYFHLYSDNTDEAIRTMLKEIEIVEESKDSLQLAISYSNLSAMIMGIQRNAEALEYMKKAIPLFKNNKKYNRLAKTYGNMGNCYRRIGDTLNAIKYYNLSIQIAIKTENIEYISEAYIVNAKFYSLHIKDKDKAKIFFQKAHSTLDKLADNYLIIKIYHEYGRFQYELKNYRNAIELSTKAYEIARANSLQTKAMYAAGTVSLSFEAQGKFKEAFPYLKIYTNLQDSLYNKRKIRDYERVYSKYQFEKQALQDSITNQQKLILIEKDKEVLAAQNNTYFITLIGGGILALFSTGFLINLRRKNQQITQQKSALEQLNATKDQLFAIISHDLRKPALAFRGISQKVRFLLEQKEFDTLDKYGSSLEKAANSLNGLLDNLLKWALQQRNMLPYRPISINVAEVTEEIMELFEQIAAEKNIALQIDIPEMTTAFVDQNAYAAIIRNLIDNAIKFTPEGGNIELQVSEQASEVLLKVKDSGIGIAKEKLAKIFDLQQQKSTQGTAGEQGTGLGLSLVKDLVALNKGSISVQSQWREGTTFELVFPTA